MLHAVRDIVFPDPNKERPLLFAMLKLRGVHGLPKLRRAIELVHRARVDMERHLDALSRQLRVQGGPWIAGEAFTLADLSWAVLLDRLVEADWEALFWGRERRPTVARYWERLQARPSHVREILDVRRAGTRRGVARLAAAKRRDATLREGLEGTPDPG
ncbi:MAG: glutathione S-transferase family protein [Myxococcota bacterium]